MTTATIESEANRTGLATADMNLSVLLRHKTIPLFFERVGKTAWRRKVASTNTVVNQNYVDLATDFHFLEKVYFGTSNFTEDGDLTYIGDSYEELAAASAATVAADPSKFYLGYTAAGALQRMYFQAPAATVGAIRYIYYRFAVFADDTTSVNMNQYVPEQYQWGLIEALKEDIFFDRYGVGDNRYEAQRERAMEWVVRAQSSMEMANHTQPRFAE